MRGDGNFYSFLRPDYDRNMLYIKSKVLGIMDIGFNKSQRRQIRKLRRCFHGKEHVDLYRVFKAIAYPLLCDVTTANTHDSKGVAMLLSDVRIHYPTVSLVKADHGYRGIDSTPDGFTVECVKSNFGTQRFIPMSGRRVVEQTNAWLENFRRLCHNHERYLSTARTMTYPASILFMLRYIR